MKPQGRGRRNQRNDQCARLATFHCSLTRRMKGKWTKPGASLFALPRSRELRVVTKVSTFQICKMFAKKEKGVKRDRELIYFGYPRFTA